MSAGKFELTRYETDGGFSAAILVQPETKLLTINGVTNAAPAGPVTFPVAVRASGNSRKKRTGLFARQVSLRWTGTPPAGYDPAGILRLPLLNAVIAAEAIKGATGSYLGAGVRVVGSVGQVPPIQ